MNLVRASSDHNLIAVYVRMKDKIQMRQEVMVRDRRNMDAQRVKDIVIQIDWTQLYQATDINIMNDILETELSTVYNEEAPIKKIQIRRNHRCWVGAGLKETDEGERQEQREGQAIWEQG